MCNKCNQCFYLETFELKFLVEFTRLSTLYNDFLIKFSSLKGSARKYLLKQKCSQAMIYKSFKGEMTFF